MHTREFAKAAKKAKEMNAQTFYRAILDERPDLADKVARDEIAPRFPSSGNSAYTVILGKEVFKTSQYDGWAPTGITTEDLILGIERERNLLGYLTGKGLPVPKLTYDGKGFSFFSVELLSGEDLTRHDVETMGHDDKRRLAKDLAAFCADFSNAVPVEEAKELGLDASPAEWKFDAEKLYAEFADPRVQEALGDRYGFFKQAIEGYIDYHHKEYADNQEHLMHCDLMEGNIRWDPKTKSFTGCIDFGLTHLTGLEAGFKKLCEKFPADFVDMVLEEYSSLQNIQLTRKELQLWAAVEYVAYALDELKTQKGAVVLRGYNEFVRSPLQLAAVEPKASVLPAQKQAYKQTPAYKNAFAY